ncbi:MAG: ATP-binding cassette domain-containing protein, partial [Nitriliruptorales bacterium]
VQVPSIYPELTVLENVWLAAYARARDQHAAERRASSVLHWLGLHDQAHRRAGVLSHGEQQWLEIGLVLTADPSVIMLDEPTAGMTRQETNRTVEIVQRLAAERAVIVVEHDMYFVRQLAAPTTVLHQGRVFAHGPLDDIRADERVLDIYLGRGG